MHSDGNDGSAEHVAAREMRQFAVLEMGSDVTNLCVVMTVAQYDDDSSVEHVAVLEMRHFAVL